MRPEVDDVTAMPRDARELFAEFYDGAFPAVWSYLRRGCLGDEQIAEDLTQEVFTGAARQLQRGNTEVCTTAWALSAARGRLIDHYRRRTREERKLSLAWSARAVDDATPELPFDSSMAALLSTLPPAQQAATVLRYLDDLPVPEVARALGRSVHATESLLARARTSLRARLQENDDAD